MMYKTKDLFSLEHSLAGEYLREFEYPWQALAGIKSYIQTLGPKLKGYREVSPQVWVHETAVIAPAAFLAPRAS